MFSLSKSFVGFSCFDEFCLGLGGLPRFLRPVFRAPTHFNVLGMVGLSDWVAPTQTGRPRLARLFSTLSPPSFSPSSQSSLSLSLSLSLLYSSALHSLYKSSFSSVLSLKLSPFSSLSIFPPLLFSCPSLSESLHSPYSCPTPILSLFSFPFLYSLSLSHILPPLRSL